MPESSPASEDLVSEILALIGRDSSESTPSAGDLFARATKKQLLDCAARLGLKGVSKLSREDLAGRIEVAIAGLRTPGAGVFPEIDAVEMADAPAVNGGGSLPQKFDLGSKDAEPMPKDIPWGYGYDRITAMAVDPMRLYVYWEATDDAIAAARANLGAAGERAWLNVRVYDITGRLFDGTNAHSYFDHRVERHERQWFFGIDKPTSTACAELGLKSEEGYFVKIVRTGRVEFPRNEPVGGGGTEWLSVRAATGPVGHRWVGAPGGGGGAPAVGPGPVGGGAGPGGGGGAPEEGGPWQDWTEHSGFPVPRGQRLFGRTWQRHESIGHQWTSESRTEWLGPMLRTEWESGPFSYPVDVPEGSIEVFDNGEVTVRSEGGRTQVMYGPWQVVIRGIGARAERRVLGTWEYRRQVAVEGGVERVEFGGGYAPGSSDWMMMGASERSWRGASELLYGGASELWLLGASELLFAGASERAFLGGSEYRFRGASERSFAGASETRLAGASERMFAGASEAAFAGASEQRFAGASERLGGASERSHEYSHDPSSPYPTPPRELK
jgi:hypothetical protein